MTLDETGQTLHDQLQRETITEERARANDAQVEFRSSRLDKLYKSFDFALQGVFKECKYDSRLTKSGKDPENYSAAAQGQSQTSC
jgi:hypothetical protein